jgi:hypothetical protein
VKKVFQAPLVFALLFLSGCAQQTQERTEKQEPLVCNTKSSSSASLILSSDQVVNVHSFDETFSPFVIPEKNLDSLFLDPQSCEARLTDIPIPLLVESQSASCSKNGAGMCLVYKTSMSDLDLISFYKKEMERFGWVQNLLFEGSEVLMVFRKPSRFCSLSLRPTKKTFFKSKQIMLHVLTGVDE